MNDTKEYHPEDSLAKLAKLKLDNANLRSEVDFLKAELRKLRPEGDPLDRSAKDILKFFFDRAKDFTVQDIARQFKLQESVVDYHFDVLYKRKFIEQLNLGTSPRYTITATGREFVMKNPG